MTHDEKAPIYDALPEDFIRRMRNWARSCDGGPVGTSRFEERIDHTRHDQPIPMLLGEADDTHAAVLKLLPWYQEVVTVFWRYEARPLRWMAGATEILRAWKLGPVSFAEKLTIAHARLQVEIGKQKSAQRKRAAISAAVQVQP